MAAAGIAFPTKRGDVCLENKREFKSSVISAWG